MKFIIIVVGLTFLVTAGLVFGHSLLKGSTFSGGSTSSGQGRIEVSPSEYDAGNVQITGGLVKKVYEIKNTGSGALKIDNIETSCACTTAVLKVGGKTSPQFSMPGHGSNPIIWSEIINSGEKGELEVIFDPAFHGPDALGPLVRVVYISSDDPNNKEVQAKLSANVIR